MEKYFLNITFPFYFRTDESLTVTEAGRSILKLVPDILYKKLDEILTIEKPNIIHHHSFDALKNLSNHLIILKLKTMPDQLTFKGQLIYDKTTNSLTYLGSPWFTKVEDLKKYNLIISDFSLSDHTVDMLQLMKVIEVSNMEVKNLNEDLKKNEEQYRQIIENSNDMIYRTDASGYLIYLNDVALKYLGMEKKQAIGMHFSNLFRDDFREKGLKYYEKVFTDQEKSVYWEFPLKTGNKEEIWIGQSLTIHGAGTKNFGFQGIAHNVTERVKYQQELINARDTAQEAANAKSQFLANMSHEIRTPLNGIVGLTSLLIKTNLNNKQKEYINAIATSSETLITIINDILDISKIEAGKLIIEQKPFRLLDSISSVLEVLNLKAMDKNLMLDAHIDDSIPEIINGDASRLSQILYNIVGNAIKFTDNGKVEIYVIAKEFTNEKVHIEFQIVDTGIGIDKVKIAEIFEPFTQENKHPAKINGGTGLGLNIVKKIISLQNGSIYVNSTPGVGSEFRVVIPFGIVNSSEDLVPPYSLDHEGQKLCLERLRILVVEDNPVNQLFAIDLLEEEKAHITLAENGQKALEIFAKENFDIILMDMQMPKMNGYEAMQHIRKNFNEEKRNVPILALTAYAVDGEAKKCKDAGANGYLAKPYKPYELINKIQEVLSGESYNTEIKLIEENQSFSNKYFDFDSLQQFTNFNEKRMLKAIDSLLKNLPREINYLKTALAEKNVLGIASITHKMKPNIMMIAIPALRIMVIEIEKEARKGFYTKEFPDRVLDLSHRLFLLTEELKEAECQLKHKKCG